LATIRQIVVFPADPRWSYREVAVRLGVGRGTLFRAAGALGLDTKNGAGVEEVKTLADHFGVEVQFVGPEAA
jgi:hypothetical protein